MGSANLLKLCKRQKLEFDKLVQLLASKLSVCWSCNFSSSTSNNPPPPLLSLSLSLSPQLSFLILFLVINIVPLSYIEDCHVCMIQQWFKRERACPSSLCNLLLLELQRRLLVLLAKRQRPSWIWSLGGSSAQRMKMTVELIEWRFKGLLLPN